ncbi:E1-E2 ATPase-domain-containing protein [Zalerion maritima]|uniref:E1-E2 ATPase-domain-containing protein n=1 Tax=Zalerion maritima TaxID=339359 RepID=A0AAD5RID3_9PEZI|nr:E1-E2 ATPase-domain-containing protein [Zalerion maritima]
MVGPVPFAASPAVRRSTEAITTSFVLDNLHCPSCVATIKRAIGGSFSPFIKWVSPNIVTSVVTIEHLPPVRVPDMANTLEAAGFDICGVTSTANTDDLADLQPAHKRHGSRGSVGQLDLDVGRWERARDSLRNPVATASKRKSVAGAARRAHLRNCEQCRQSGANPQGSEKCAAADCKKTDVMKDLPPIPKVAAPRPVMSTKPLVTIERDDAKIAEAEWKVVLAVGGMTCAACANSITEELDSKPWVHKIVVNLVANSATVELYDQEKAGKVAEEIEDIGFDATVDSVTKIEKAKKVEIVKVELGWRVVVAVGGMTCAACSNLITDSLGAQPWVSNMVVNLVSNSATVEVYDREKAEQVAEEIEDLGYDATIDSITKIESEEEEQRQERTAEIKVDGFYCFHCPDRVVSSLRGFQKRVSLHATPTSESPIVKVTYVPDAPAFTVRHIMAAIEASDPAFKASVHHPPSIEERSKQIRARHQKQILIRAMFTGLIVIPTFVIGIAYMNLVSDDDPGRHFLMEPWTSGINRAQIALLILATPVYFLAADIFHRRAFKEIKIMWRPGSKVPLLRRFYRFGSMNTLMSLGTTIAYVSSVSQLIAAAVYQVDEVKNSNFYFDSVVFLTFFLLCGRLIESFSKSKTGDAVEMLGKLRPNTAILVEDAGTARERDVEVAADTLEFGDRVKVRNGSSPPCDGLVVHGKGAFDESSLTGESRLVQKEVGGQVFAGTVNKTDPVTISVAGVSGTSMLDNIVSVVREGQTKRAPMEHIADVLTTYFVPVITSIAIATWVTWLGLGLSGAIPDHFLEDSNGGWVAFSLQFAIAVFVVACPCGLALAAPTAIFVGGGLAANHGILAKGGGEAFQKASKVDVVVFDKTGTLTEGGAPTITDHRFFLNSGPEKMGDAPLEENVIAALKSVEESSSHPIAKAIVSWCKSEKSSHIRIDDLQEVAGKGMEALCLPTNPQVGKFELIVGNEALLGDFGVHLSRAVKKTLHGWEKEAKSIALVATKPVTDNTRKAKDDEQSRPWVVDPPFQLTLALAIADPIRPAAASTIASLHASNIGVFMLSGDNQVTASAVAARVGIAQDRVIANVLPTDKASQIKRLQQTLHPVRVSKGGYKTEDLSRRATVLMVGDGINDSPALTMADVGVAIGSGSDVAISSAAFVLVNSNIQSVSTLLNLSRVVFRRIKFNFGWALVYNCVMVPVAAGCLYPITVNGEHVRLDPVWASLAMAMSSISVVLSSLALKTRWPLVGFRDPVIDEAAIARQAALEEAARRKPAIRTSMEIFGIEEPAPVRYSDGERRAAGRMMQRPTVSPATWI